MEIECDLCMERLLGCVLHRMVRFISPQVAKHGSATYLQQTDPIFPGDVNRTGHKQTKGFGNSSFLSPSP